MAAQVFAPAFSFLRVDPLTGDAAILGSRCAHCGVVIIGERLACPACCARGKSQCVVLDTAGALRTHTIVWRSFPGVNTPFVAAVVDLDGGGSLRGTLRDVAPDPACLPAGLRVDIVFADTGQKDDDGRTLICHHFRIAA
jgi:uncharacterized OB-fold protein